jgi:hypothetical protein
VYGSGQRAVKTGARVSDDHEEWPAESRVQGDTYAEHPKGIVEGNVAFRDTGEDFIAPQVAFKKRTMAQLFEEIANFSERPG